MLKNICCLLYFENVKFLEINCIPFYPQSNETVQPQTTYFNILCLGLGGGGGSVIKYIDLRLSHWTSVVLAVTDNYKNCMYSTATINSNMTSWYVHHCYYK